MLLATAATVLSLLQRIEEASHAEPPIFQVETLLQTARLLKGEPRARFAASALRANAAVRDEASRETYQMQAAWLLDKPAAGALCREIQGPGAARCWARVDVLEAVRVLSYFESELRGEASEILAAKDVALAEALVGKWQKKTPAPPKKKPAGAPAEIERKMNRVDDERTSDAERSRLLREVLEASDTIVDPTERLMHEGVITAWFAENREEATAALAAAKLHRTFAAICQCEDGQCDSVAGRAECSENIDFFVEFLAEKRIDPAVLRIRHPSLAARALVVKLKEAMQ
ncbi:MAG: hypothetical protein JNM66_06425 [Bryobacterales bacterium]|nr:hypothetical protein [Bryobacterales bacterium]